jgi:cytochrome c oxidase assembly factor CtaG
MRALAARLAAAALLVPAAAAAHTPGAAAGSTPWTLDPAVTLPLLAGLALFVAGDLRLRARLRRSTPELDRRAGLFAAGWLVLAAALTSPLHAAGERSFAAHMIEHELLMLAAAPLLVLSRPLAVMLWAFGADHRRLLGAAARSRPLAAAWRALTRPLTATVAQAAALWLWHAPAAFDRALSSDAWHVAQHLSFLVSALLFWSAMLHPRRRAYGAAALCLFATSVVSGALGALMAFAQSPWYAGYVQLGMSPYGLTPLEDQQLAGLLMWAPGGLVHAGAALAMIGAALQPAKGSARAVEP